MQSKSLFSFGLLLELSLLFADGVLGSGLRREGLTLLELRVFHQLTEIDLGFLDHVDLGADAESDWVDFRGLVQKDLRGVVSQDSVHKVVNSGVGGLLGEDLRDELSDESDLRGLSIAVLLSLSFISLGAQEAEDSQDVPVKSFNIGEAIDKGDLLLKLRNDSFSGDTDSVEAAVKVTSLDLFNLHSDLSPVSLGLIDVGVGKFADSVHNIVDSLFLTNGSVARDPSGWLGASESGSSHQLEPFLFGEGMLIGLSQILRFLESFVLSEGHVSISY